MNLNELISLCQCPCCRAGLEAAGAHDEVRCVQGHVFPVFNRTVPVLLTSAEKTRAGNKVFTDTKTARHFGNQWKMYKKGDKIWGLDDEEWKRRFFEKTGYREQDLAGKLILDLGCGHGVHSTLMAQMGARVVGSDITNGFFRTELEKDPEVKDRLNFVRGDITNFCFKDEIFDFVWCEGVLHHTPNTKASFLKAARAVKKGGRFYFWVYGVGQPFHRVEKTARVVSTRLPEWLLVPLCYLGAPFYILLKKFLNLISKKHRKFEKRSIRETALSMHDSLSPPYAWHHTPGEVLGWFKETDYGKITVLDFIAYGVCINAVRSEGPVRIEHQEHAHVCAAV